jgi:integrase
MKTLEVLDKVIRGKRVKEATKRHYQETLSSLARYESEWPVSGVVINEWLAGLTNYADTTIKMWFDFVNAAGKYIEKAYGLTNPCKTAERPKVEKKRRRYFTPDEMVNIIMACRFDRDKALILTLIDSTCRIGELAGLKGRNVGNGWIDVKGKTGERRYRLDPVICDMLKDMAGSDDNPVFKGVSGEAATVDSLQHYVRRVVKEAGITGSKLGPHTLRHSGASLVARETGSALAVKALLQHDNIETSMQYIHDAEDMIQQRISPLKLMTKMSNGSAKEAVNARQLTMEGVKGGNSTALVIVEPVEVVEGVVDLLEEEFPEIKEGVKVRPLLKTEDLRLLRSVSIKYVRLGGDDDKMKLKILMKRMLKKVRD